MSNHDIQATWHYHNGTKHPSGRLMNPQHGYDPSRQPLLFKIYKDLPSISLPLNLAPIGVTARFNGSEIRSEEHTSELQSQ